MKKFRLKHFLAFLLILLLGGAILAIPLIHFTKQWGYNQLLQDYETYTQSEDYRLAFQKAYRAHQLFPEQEKAQLALARASLNHPHQNADQFWREVLDSPLRTPEDLKDYVRYLLETFQLERAFELTERLYREMPDDEEVHQIYLQSLVRNRKFVEVVAVTRRLIEEGFDALFLYENLYAALWAINTQESKKAAIALMAQEAERQDAIGASASRRLLGLQLLPEPRELDLAQSLLENPEATQADRLLALSRLLELDALDSHNLESKIEEYFNLQDFEDLEIVARWYFNRNEPEKTLQLAPAQRFLESPETSTLYHLALIETGKAQQAYESTFRTDRDPGLRPVDLLLIRARAQWVLGKEDEFGDSLNLAVEQAALNDFSELESALIESGAWPTLDRLYLRILEIEELQAIGLQKIIWSKYLQGDEYQLLKYLRRTDLEDYREEPPVLAFLAYLKLLFDPQSLETHFIVEELVTEFPNVADFRFVQAMAFYQGRQFDFAWKLTQDQIEPVIQKGTRFQKLILLISAFSASEPPPEWRTVYQSLQEQNLLPSEQRLLLNAGLKRTLVTTIPNTP